MMIVARRPGSKTAAIMLDEEGYAELRWWADPAAAPADTAADITRVLAQSVSLDADPYAVVTGDLDELHAALIAGQQARKQ